MNSDLEELKKQAEEIKSIDTKNISLEQLSSLIERVDNIINKGEENLQKIVIEDEKTISGTSL